MQQEIGKHPSSCLGNLPRIQSIQAVIGIALDAHVIGCNFQTLFRTPAGAVNSGPGILFVQASGPSVR